MSWFDIFKKRSPAEKFTEAKFMLLEVFNVPIDELDNLNIPPSLTHRLRKDSNLETIDEDKFTVLMMLSEKGRYQDIVDTLSKFLDDAQAERTAEKTKIYRNSPKYKEYLERQRTSPKYKEYQRKYNEKRREKRRKNRKG